MAFQPTPVIFKPSQQRGRDVTVYLIPRKRDICFEFSYFNKSKAGVIETYICTGCCGLKDKNRQVNYGVVPTVRVLNGAFIDDPENPRWVHYCQPKSAARALIPREVITKCNSLRREQATRLLTISDETSWLLFLSWTMVIRLTFLSTN